MVEFINNCLLKPFYDSIEFGKTTAFGKKLNIDGNEEDESGGSGVAGYDVYRNGALVGATAALSYTDSALSPATSYTYAIRARDNAGNVAGTSSSSDSCSGAADFSARSSALISSQRCLTCSSLKRGTSSGA